MVDRMAELGSPATAPPRVVHLWGIAIVLRAESADGAMFLKRSARIFAQEAAVTGLLADVTPDLVTRVAAVEPDEGWLLMYDHGAQALGDGPPERWRVGRRPTRHDPAGMDGTDRGPCPGRRTRAPHRRPGRRRRDFRSRGRLRVTALAR